MMTLDEASRQYLATLEQLSADDAFALGCSIAMGLLTAAKSAGELAQQVSRLCQVDGLVMLIVERERAGLQWAQFSESETPLVGTHPVAHVIVTEVVALVGDYLRKRVGQPVAPSAVKA